MNKTLTIIIILIVIVIGIYFIMGDKENVSDDNQNDINVEYGMGDTFLEEGIVVFNNPEMEENVYHLTYNGDDSHVKLIFRDDSICKIVDGDDCKDVYRVVDKKVKVEGSLVDGNDLSKGIIVDVLTKIEEVE